MHEKRPKNGVLGTLRCRQIGRRGLNRKSVMIDRFHVPNYPPVQIFSEKYDKMSEGALWVFLYQYTISTNRPGWLKCSIFGRFWPILATRGLYRDQNIN